MTVAELRALLEQSERDWHWERNEGDLGERVVVIY